MTIPFRIVIGHPLSFSQKEEALRLIDSTFQEIDAIYNKWNPMSELSGLNRLKAGTKARPSEKLYQFLKFTDRLVAITEGRFDPTIETLQQVWKKHLEQGRLPGPLELEAASSSLGWNQIHLDEGFFWKDHDSVSLDLGGIAKGFAIDLLTDRLAEAGYRSVFVEWGGEIRAKGVHPAKRPWKVMINKENIIDLSGWSVATSGDCFQAWNVNGETFFHILNPHTGMALKKGKHSISSATVKASTCAYADAIATSLMMFGSKEEAMQWAKSLNPEITVWIEDEFSPEKS